MVVYPFLWLKIRSSDIVTVDLLREESTMGRVCYAKNTTIGGLLFEYVFKGGVHYWVFRREGRDVYSFYEAGDGRYILSAPAEGETWSCTSLSGLSKQITCWEVRAGNTEPFFCPSQQANVPS